VPAYSQVSFPKIIKQRTKANHQHSGENAAEKVEQIIISAK